MDRWSGKTAVVTGASAGIGAAVCVGLADAGIHVLGLARRPHLVDELKPQVKGGGSIVGRECDVSKVADIAAAFQRAEQLGGVDLLVNNAGVFHRGHITDAGSSTLSEEQVLSMIDVNLKATILCTRHAVASMNRRGVDGHVININSIAGHYLPFSPEFNVYSSSKYGVTAFSGALLGELADAKSRIKVTSISPGLVRTSMTVEAVDHVGFPPLEPQDIADAVLYAVATPPSVNISEITIQPVGEIKL